MRHRTALIAVVLFQLTGVGALSAQIRKPEFSLSPRFDSPRSHAPLQLDARLSWTSVDLLIGRLHLEFFAGQRLQFTWVSREVALSANHMTLSVMIPPAILARDRDTLSARASFFTAETTYDLDFHDLTYPVDYKRALTIGVVHPETAGLPPPDFTTPFQDRFAWVEPFRLDDALPNLDWSRHMTCRIVPVDPEMLPDEPLELAAFDLLIVTSAGLDDLHTDQLNAIADWVEAGGALCVAGAWAGSEVQQAFLSRVADSWPVDPVFDFDGDGNIRMLRGNQQDRVLASPGVGRSVVTLGPVDVLTEDWKRTVLELWRVRPEQMESILTTGAWEYSVEADYWVLLPMFQPLRPETAAEPDHLQAQLMPERVEGVPLPTVALLLAACLLAVAPGDYFLLGWLNRRRWTWILFPSIALGFAVFTVRLAQSHMGQTDHRTTLTVVDLRRDGRAVRTSAFELLFAATDREIEEELSRTMAAPLQYRNPMRIEDSFRNAPTRDDSVSTPTTPAFATGRVPRSYAHIRGLRQWTPRMTRYTAISPANDIDVPDFDWSRLNGSAVRDQTRRQHVLNDLQANLPDARIALLHEDEIWQPVPPRVGDDSGPAGVETRELPLELAVNLSARPAAGMFHIVSQISPNAAGNFEDLSLLDRTDPRQWLLVIVTGDNEGNLNVYRRLIRAGST